jgi:CRISPR-associated protein Csx3
MFNPLPAILIGGPPHAGKSVLTYSLTQALRERKIDHYVIRACPDGEGDWSQEIDQDAVRVIRIKGSWTPGFVERVCRDLERRHFPLLVDIGGRPEVWQRCILSNCTHSLLLLHPHDEPTIQFWRQLVEENGLLPLAQLYSVLDGTSTVTSQGAVLQGTLTGLNRNSLAHGQLFDLLVERVAALFSSYSSEELRRGHLASAPAEVVDLDVYLHLWAPQTKRWKPEMLSPLLAELPANAPLAVYGRGPNWLYGALVMRTGTEPFYQFDSRLGWVGPPPLEINILDPNRSSALHVWTEEHPEVTVLKIDIVTKYLDYTEAEHLSFPPVPTERGLILSGVMPHWLVTALVHLYVGAGVQWIACHQPQLKGAIGVVSRTSKFALGDLLPMPAP